MVTSIRLELQRVLKTKPGSGFGFPLLSSYYGCVNRCDLFVVFSFQMWWNGDWGISLFMFMYFSHERPAMHPTIHFQSAGAPRSRRQARPIMIVLREMRQEYVFKIIEFILIHKSSGASSSSHIRHRLQFAIIVHHGTPMRGKWVCPSVIT